MSEPRRIEFDGAVHSLTAIKKAAYRFIDTFAVELNVVNGRVLCDLHFPNALSDAEVQAAVGDFRSEVLDQDLREQLKKETAQVRNLILAHAFSKTGIPGDE